MNPSLPPYQADHLPKHCQRLQALVQTKPVGKAAIFHKVDSLVRATRPVSLLECHCYQFGQKKSGTNLV